MKSVESITLPAKRSSTAASSPISKRSLRMKASLTSCSGNSRVPCWPWIATPSVLAFWIFSCCWTFFGYINNQVKTSNYSYQKLEKGKILNLVTTGFHCKYCLHFYSMTQVQDSSCNIIIYEMNIMQSAGVFLKYCHY